MSGLDWFMLGLLLFGAIVFRGWPTFITIHKHYHKDGGDRE